jgi:thiol-disulfide isomerase/thioredoxin
MLMRSVRSRSGLYERLATMKVRHRTWLLLSSAMTVGLVVIVVGVRMAVEPGPSPDTAALAAIDVTAVTPPKPIPPVAFADEAGHSLSLADFKGRAVLLNLWATWCVPCQKEMSSLDRLQAKLGGPRFQVIAVSIDKQGGAVVQSFYRQLGLQALGVYLDPSGKAPSTLGIEGVPATLLIDVTGREIGRKLGALEWDSPAVIDTLRKVTGLIDVKQGTSTPPDERRSS